MLRSYEDLKLINLRDTTFMKSGKIFKNRPLRLISKACVELRMI